MVFLTITAYKDQKRIFIWTNIDNIEEIKILSSLLSSSYTFS